MSRGAKIRPATVRDAGAIAALLAELGYPASTPQVEERLRRLDGEAGVECVVALVGDDVAGFAALRIENLIEHDQPACRLAALAVAERHRRRGVGAALVNAVEEVARERRCYAVVLTSGDHRRDDAHRFYRALGYDDTGRRFIKLLGS